MWKDVLHKKTKLFHFHLELTSKCNAACPHCPRFIRGTPVRDPNLNLWEMGIDKVKSWYSNEIIQKIGSMNICGNFGDPAVCKDMVEIVEYFHTTNPNIDIEIRTNGGPRNVQFWKKLGKLSKNSNEKIKTIFSIDGLEDTNHLYRRNVKWELLERNVTSYINAGGYAQQEFLIFDHNDHQIEEARINAHNWKIKDIAFKQPIGFENFETKKSNPIAVYTKKGDLDYLIKPSDTFKNSEFPFHDNSENILEKRELFNNSCIVDAQKLDYSKYIESESAKIDCKAVHDNGHIEVYFNSNGDVRPCCHIGVEIDRNFHEPVGRQLKQILGHDSLYNLNTNSLENILELFDIRIEGTWEKKHNEGRCVKCSLQCGTANEVDQKRLYVDNDALEEKISEELELKEIDEIINEMFKTNE